MGDKSEWLMAYSTNEETRNFPGKLSTISHTPYALVFERRALELRGSECVRDGNDSVHDGMEAAEVGVAAGSQPLKGKAAVWPDDSGIECAGVTIF
jgi:hypothetical protein